MEELDDLIERATFGNPPIEWLIAAGVAAAVFFGLLALRRFIAGRYRRYAATEETEFLEIPLKIASETKVAFLLLVAIFIGLITSIELPAAGDRFLRSILT
ncbi:MAG TPA: hypothetical protein VLT59_16715, partial [Steroidobacteraceae bacterium]|nr:hypothetical protein [Steroidobacteraceae bacterium]